jgi:hypothetical protein
MNRVGNTANIVYLGLTFMFLTYAISMYHSSPEVELGVVLAFHLRFLLVLCLYLLFINDLFACMICSNFGSALIDLFREV